MIIRPATLHDAKNLVLLTEQWGYPQITAAMTERLKIYTGSEQYCILVAENTAGTITGFIALSMNELFVKPGKRCRVEGLVVDQSARRQGIGGALIEAAESYAKNHGCLVIDLTSGMRRAGDGTHEFYKKLGYNNEGPRAKLYLRKELI